MKAIMMLLVILVAGACSNRVDRTIAKMNSLLDSLQHEYAPDRRIALWDMELTGSKDLITLSGEVDNRATYKAIVRAIDQQFPEVSNGLVLLPEEGNGQLVNGVVNNSVIHLRREPSSKTELVTQALLGTPVRILKEEDGKSLIQVPDGYIGWVNAAEVHAMEPEDLTRYKEAEKIVFEAQYGFAFSEPDENSLPVTDLVIGNILSILPGESEFYQVNYPDGRQGWVKKSEATPAGEVFYKTTLKEGVVQTALRYHGIPYLWGGNSSKNIDCSGLVSNTYFMNGIQLPRDADLQSLCGRKITTDFNSEGLVAGDLLFFGRKAADGNRERVTHVAMYIGNGEYIHSAGYRERVSINSMDSTKDNFIESYPEIFLRTVRIIGEETDGFLPIAENEFYKEIISTTE